MTLVEGRLEIIRLQRGDAGVYECEVRQGSDAVVRATAIDVVKPEAGASRLCVAKPPSLPSVCAAK